MENHEDHSLDVSEREKLQIQKIVVVVKEIFDVSIVDVEWDLMIKFSVIPEKEHLQFCSDELKVILIKFLSYSDDIKRLLSEYVAEYRNYYKYCKLDKEPDVSMQNRFKDFPKEWLDSFIVNYVIDDENYLNYDLDSIIIDEIDEIDHLWFNNIEKYIPIKGISELVDCIKTFYSFILMFDFYHLGLEWKSRNK
jgi:hypothetical protein